jgi:hypothetical protein
MKRFRQSGSHIVALSLLVFALGVVSITGYMVMQRQQKADTVLTSDIKLSVPKTVDSKADLDATAKALDETSADLDSSMDGSVLDGSMNDLL